MANEEITFYENQKVNICLYLVQHPLKTIEIIQQLPRSFKKLLDQFKNIVVANSNNLERTNVLKYKIHLIHPFPIIA